MEDVGEMLAVYLAGPGEVPGIGRETGRPVSDGIAVYKSPHGSHRYVRYVLGVPLAALQLVSRDGKHATTANVYTSEIARRKGYASELLARARRDFVTVEHAAPEHRSPAGAAWVDTNKRRGNPAEDRDDAIAWTVLDSARRAPRFGTRKVFVSDLHRQLRLEGRDDGMTLTEIKRELFRLMRAGKLQLARADLVAAMPADKVRDSEIAAEGATFHFIVLGDGARQNPPRTRKNVLDTFAEVLLQRGSQAIAVAQDLLEEAEITLAEASLDPSSAGILADDADAYGWFLLDNLGPNRVVRVDWNCKQTAEGYRVTWHVLVGGEDRWTSEEYEEYQEYSPYQEWPRHSPERKHDGKVLKQTRDEALSTAASFAWVLCKLIKRHDSSRDYPRGIHDWIHNFLIACFDNQYSIEDHSPFRYEHPPTPRSLIVVGQSAKAHALRIAYDEELHQNPSPSDEGPMPSSKAIRRYTGFHQKDPKQIGSFSGSLVIPSRAILIGDAVHVLYKSDKLNPTTGVDEGWINYIHEHDGGVRVYRCDGRARGDEHAVPQWLQRADDLVWLGQCNGFAYQDDDGVHEAKGSKPLPDLFCTPNGKALLIIQNKRTLLAMIWGGRLGVQPRGIVH